MTWDRRPPFSPGQLVAVSHGVSSVVPVWSGPRFFGTVSVDSPGTEARARAWLSPSDTAVVISVCEGERLSGYQVDLFIVSCAGTLGWVDAFDMRRL